MSAASPITREEAKKLLAPLAGYPHLALAVSGGPDSTALLHLAAEWRAGRGGEPRMTVLTVDHGLRPESRSEAALVVRHAARLGLPQVTLAWQRSEALRAGVQAAARAARYDLMAAYCQAHGIAAIVTAHTQDDQAETVLMRLARGSGLDGLAAIPVRTRWGGIDVLRPLLDVAKARLVATLAADGVSYALDTSNADPRFERARLRACGEALARLGLSSAALARSARRLGRARAALDHAADAFLAEHSRLSEAGFCVVDAHALIAAPDEIGLRALAQSIAAVSGREPPVRLSKLEALLGEIKEVPHKTHTLGGCRIAPLRDGLGVFRETRRTGLPRLRLAPGERALWDNRFRVELGGEAGAPVTVGALGEAAWREARASAPWLADLPCFAGATLPACFRDEELIFVPELGASAARGAHSGFAARFVGGREGVEKACTSLG
jgi:tRNA(Ile)-lysidine synthase